MPDFINRIFIFKDLALLCCPRCWLQNRGRGVSTNRRQSLVKCCWVNILRRAPGYHRCLPFNVLKVLGFISGNKETNNTHLHQVFKDSVQSSSADFLVCVSRSFTLWALMNKANESIQMTPCPIRSSPVDWNLCIEDIDHQRWGPFWLSRPVQR